MKVLIVSDTHKSHGNLRKAIEDSAPIDMLIHLGDVEGGEGDIKALDQTARKFGHEIEYTELLMGGASIDVHGVPLTDETIAAARVDDAGTLDEVLTVHQYGVAMTILNASMRIMRISHIDMQRVLYSLTRDFDAMCRTATRTPLEQMSNYAPMTDILAASHVKAHVRLFMG